LTPLVNQVGYAVSERKFALLPADAPDCASIESLDGSVCWVGSPSLARPSLSCSLAFRLLDFSDLRLPGNFILRCGAYSISIVVAGNPFISLARSLLKGFYFQRASLDLLPCFAGRWARPLGHSDDAVLVHPSAASASRPAGSKICSPGGWYDAGDYNKYMVTSAVSVSSLLGAFSDLGPFVERLCVDIPESTGPLPDVLAEVRWNLEWMLSMQDPEDGGVYHKLTNLRFDGMLLPHLCVEPRFVVSKSTAASLGFAAACAEAFLVYQRFDLDFSHRCLKAALSAYSWAFLNPDVFYVQPNDVRTGVYGDSELNDEFYWAEMALFTATRDSSFLARARTRNPRCGVPSWQSVASFGNFQLLRHFPQSEPERSKLLTDADTLIAAVGCEGLSVSMRPEDFVWGSNGVAANQGMLLLHAFRLTGREHYRDAAFHLLDYLCGRNPTTYCFVTGAGSHSPCHIHHRPSQGDSVKEPIPGLLVGGPNAGRQDADKCPPYPSIEPALSYLDHVDSCASNEIAINWNAPAFYLAAGLCSRL